MESYRRSKLFLTQVLDLLAGFIIWSVKPWGSAHGYKRPPQGVNAGLFNVEFVAA